MLPLIFLLATQVHADDKIYKILLQNHLLVPAEITVPSNETIVLEITNEDGATEEIESQSLKFEKIIPPKKTVKIRLNKIREGSHDIYGEFYSATCQGRIIAK